MNSDKKTTETPALESIFAIYADFEVSTRRSDPKITRFFRDSAAATGRRLEGVEAEKKELEDTLHRTEVELSATKDRISVLGEGLTSARKLLGAATIVNLLGSTLVAFGVNYLTNGQATPGWPMLIGGITIQTAIPAIMMASLPRGSRRE